FVTAEGLGKLEQFHFISLRKLSSFVIGASRTPEPSVNRSAALLGMRCNTPSDWGESWTHIVYFWTVASDLAQTVLKY
ncbi:MAG: hypothetical protein KDK53_06295, partial [Maritimibacter sp.]|nr:hypothetical protein [Maritimibacter sp.]